MLISLSDELFGFELSKTFYISSDKISHLRLIFRISVSFNLLDKVNQLIQLIQFIAAQICVPLHAVDRNVMCRTAQRLPLLVLRMNGRLF